METWAHSAPSLDDEMDSDSPQVDQLDWPDFVAQSRITLVDGKTNNRKHLLLQQLLPLASKRE